ncbi:MAG: M56 family metallopeptidase, partial [Oscillospiraceae bacterium]
MEEIFLQILNMSLMASVAILVVMLIRIPLKKAPKSISYALWSVVLFRLVCPVSFESIFSLIPSSKPLPQEIIIAPNPIINSGFPVLDQAVKLPVPTLGESVNPMQILLLISSIVWISGVFVLVCYSIISYFLLKRKVGTAMLIEGNVYESEEISSPFVLGIIKPKIYLPLGLPAAQREYILKHEQTHIKRLDTLIKPIAFLVLSVHWFNPLCWFAFVLMSKDMELSCDEAVIKAMGSGIKCDYSTSLLSLATGQKMPNGSPLAFGESNVKARIKNVLNYKKPAFWVVIVAIAAVVVVGIGLVANPKSEDQNSSIGAPVSNKIMASASLDNGFDVELILVEGRTFSAEEAGFGGGLYDTNFNGEYELQVLKSGNVVSKIPSDTFQPISTYGGLNFPSEFNLVVGDYNGDANPDFSIGQFSGSSGHSYLIFSVNDKGKLETLKTSTDLWVQSNEFSIGFNNISSDTFEFEAYNKAIAATEKYQAKWNGKQFDIQKNQVYSFNNLGNGDCQLSFNNTTEFSEFGEKNEGFAYLEKAKNQLHVGITTAIGQQAATDETPVGSLAGAKVTFDLDFSDETKLLNVKFTEGGSGEKEKFAISDERLVEIGMRFYEIIEQAKQNDEANKLLSWANELSANDVKSIELMIEPSAVGKRYKKYAANEFADIVQIINESKGKFMPYNETIFGSVQTLYITQNDGQKHTISNAGNVFIIIDGQYYKGDYELLSGWNFKGNSAVPAEFYEDEQAAVIVKEGELSPDDFVKEIVGSFQIKEGVARFIIPSKKPSGYELSQLSVHISGAMPIGNDSQMS